jgi:hypothetical protein
MNSVASYLPFVRCGSTQKVTESITLPIPPTDYRVYVLLYQFHRPTTDLLPTETTDYRLPTTGNRLDSVTLCTTTKKTLPLTTVVESASAINVATTWWNW